MSSFWKVLSIMLACVGGPVLAAELGQVGVAELRQQLQDGKPLVVDIRSEAEQQASGIIPSSHMLPAFDREGKFDAVKWRAELEKLKSSPDQPVVLVCRTGHRSRIVGDQLAAQGMNELYHLSDGIQGWIKAAGPLVKTE